MRKEVLSLTAVLLFFCPAPFFAAAQTTEEQIITGRFGAEEAAAGDAGSGGKTYKNQWLFLGARLGPSLRFYTPSGDTAFTGGDTYGISMDAGIQASVQIAGAFSIQAEAIFTWDRASLWLYIYNAARKDEDRYTRQFSGVSLQFPVTAKLNFYPGKWRVSPFFGAYFFLPLGELSMGSPYDEAGSYSYSVFPPLGLLGGVSAGIPLGPGIIFADLRYAADLGEPELKGGGEIETYRRHMLSLSFGYEFGFFRKR